MLGLAIKVFLGPIALVFSVAPIYRLKAGLVLGIAVTVTEASSFLEARTQESLTSTRGEYCCVS